MPALRLGSIAPDFEAATTTGPIKFHEWAGSSWVCVNLGQETSHPYLCQVILFSHPADFTPVCTTELGEVARRESDFAKRGVKVIGISANALNDHHEWINDINEYGCKIGPTDVQFPIVSIN